MSHSNGLDITKNEFSVEGVCIVTIYSKRTNTHLAVLEVVKQNIETFALNTILLYYDAGASNYLTRVTLPVDLAQSGPSTENLCIPDLDHINFVLGTEGLDELNVLRLRAGLNEDAQVGLALVQSFGALAETTSKTVVD